jgi:hypothetical protein
MQKTITYQRVPIIRPGYACEIVDHAMQFPRLQWSLVGLRSVVVASRERVPQWLSGRPVSIEIGVSSRPLSFIFQTTATIKSTLVQPDDQVSNILFLLCFVSSIAFCFCFCFQRASLWIHRYHLFKIPILTFNHQPPPSSTTTSTYKP